MVVSITLKPDNKNNIDLFITAGSDSFRLAATLFGNDNVTSTEYFLDSSGVNNVGSGGFAPSMLKRKLNFASAKGSTEPAHN